MNYAHAWIAAIAAMLPLAASASPLFTVTDLGSLGGSAGAVCSINSLGQVVGAYQAPDLTVRPFSYFDGAFTELTPSFASEELAHSINDQGEIAGTTYVDGRAQATLWNDGEATLLSGMDGSDSYATAINNSGTVAGMAVTASDQGHPFTYGGGVMRDLGLPDRAVWGSAYGVNANGQVAGYSLDAAGRFSAFVWSDRDGYVMIGGLGGRSSYAMAINDRGDVAGHALTGSGYAHAFLYSDGVLRNLGTLGGNASYAYGVNAYGAVVGYSLLQDGLMRAFLYDGSVMLDLNTALGADSAWELTQAYGINDAGQIVGAGMLDGKEHGFLLTPFIPTVRLAFLEASPAPAAVPEPETGVLIALALCIGLAWHYRRSSRQGLTAGERRSGAGDHRTPSRKASEKRT